MYADETRGIGTALIAFVTSVAKRSPDIYNVAIEEAYAAVEKEQADYPTHDMRLGFEFLELAEGCCNSILPPDPGLQ